MAQLSERQIGFILSMITYMEKVLIIQRQS